jgi:ATP-dependent Clp protease adaptor protein ClpS
MANIKTDTVVTVVDKVILSPPRMWNVWLLNDDQTSMEFVVLVLMQIFHRSFIDAKDIMMNIHNNDRGIAGTYSHEVATQKRDETIAIARKNGYPLVADMTPVE